MTFDQLCDFIENKMSMSHIYQPLLIKTLLESGGSSTVRDIALEFLSYDESQIKYYGTVAKNMPIRVLKSHGVVEKNKDLVELTAKGLSFSQRQKLKSLCDQRLNDFLESRGLKLWDYRLLADPVPDSMRYRVLKASNFRCELCGATKNERPLDVDHIIPRSKKGKTEESNLQVLCSKCNRSKGNKDDTDFRQTEFVDEVEDCHFCGGLENDRIVSTNESVYAILDKYPVTPLHHLIIPFRHTNDFFTMTERERSDSNALIRQLKNSIKEQDDSVVSFNVGMNCGEEAGQTVMHSHIHLIPRRKGDTPKPRGGVRGVIPNKMDY